MTHVCGQCIYIVGNHLLTAQAIKRWAQAAGMPYLGG